MKKIILAALLSSITTTGLYAGCVTGWCSDVEITRIYISASGTINVKTSGDQTALDCTSAGSNTYLEIPNTGTQNALYSFFLTAKTTKSKVLVRIVEGSTGCQIAYAY